MHKFGYDYNTYKFAIFFLLYIIYYNFNFCKIFLIKKKFSFNRIEVRIYFCHLSEINC